MNRNGGFFKLIALVVIGVLILAYFGVDMRKYIDSPTGQAIIAKTTSVSLYVWNSWLERPALYVWNDLILVYVWPTIERQLEKAKPKITEWLFNTASSTAQ